MNMPHESLIVATLTLVASLFAYWKARQAVAKIEEVHITFNSRMDDLMERIRKEAFALGKTEGRAEGQDRPVP